MVVLAVFGENTTRLDILSLSVGSQDFSSIDLVGCVEEIEYGFYRKSSVSVKLSSSRAEI